MPDCERTERCPYFTEYLEDLKAMQEMWKEKYCREDKSQCARYMVLEALGPDRIPRYLAPTQIDGAKDLIAEAEHVANKPDSGDDK